MKRAWRWLWRGALAVLALAIVGVGALLIALHTDWGRDQIRVRAEAAIAESFSGTVRIGRIDGSVFGTLVARDLELIDHEGRQVVKVGSIQIQLALLPLLGRTARVQSLVIDDVLASIHATKTPPPELPPTEPSAWNVELPHIVATNVRVAIERTAGPITLEGIEVGAAALLPVDGPITATARVFGTWKERNAPIHVYAGARIGDSIEVPFASVDIGGVRVAATGIDLGRRAGHVFVAGSVAEVARLLPGVELPGDVVMAVDAITRDEVTQVALIGKVGVARIDGALEGNISARTAHGVIAATDVELAAVTQNRVHGRGTAVVAFAAEANASSGPHARGAVIATGEIDQAPHGAVVLGFDARLNRADVFAIGGADGVTQLGAVGALVRKGSRFEVVDGAVGVSTQDPRAASAGRAPVRGSVSLTATVRGPIDALDVEGRITARRLRFEDLGAGGVTGTFRATLSPTPSGRARITATGVTRQGALLGRATLDARTVAGGRFAVTARAHPTAAPVIVDADAVITPGEVIDVALGRHRVQTATSTWTGRGGTVRVDDRTITVKGVSSSSGTGRVSVDATIGRTAPTLAVTVDARDVPASILDAAYCGTVTGAVKIERRGTRWSGGGTITGTGLAMEPEARRVDAEVVLKVDGRRVTLSGKATNPELGGARIALEVDGPRDLIDLDAWRLVTRDDLHAIVLGFDALQPRFVTQDRVPGVYDGTLEVREGVPSGAIHVRDIPTRVGVAKADVTLALTDVGFVDVTATATAGSLGEARLAARVQLPDRPFDLAAWQRLGKHVIVCATARSSEIAIGPSVLALFGVDLPYHARANVDAVVGSGAGSAELKLELLDIHGGGIAQGVSVVVSARSDATGTSAELRASTNSSTLAETKGIAVPVTLAQWIADPQAALAARLSGRLDIPRQPLADVLAIVERRDIERGTIAGTATLAGTIAKPTGALTLELNDVAVVPGLARRSPPTLESLRVNAAWDGTIATLDITGKESGKGTLAIAARGRPDQLATAVATVTIDDFEIAPIAVLMPGVLAGASGLVDANLGIRGLAPGSAHVRGTLAIADARMPLTPVIGTLRDANAQIEIKDSGLTAKLDGKVGGGKIVASANAGAGGKETKFTAKLTDVAPIGVLQPKITADVSGTLRRNGLQITGDVAITNTVVRIPDEEGSALLEPGAPSDLFFVDVPIPERADEAHAPERPWLILDVTLAPTRIEAPRFSVVSSLLATAEGRVKVSVGETIGMEGKVEVQRGNADLFGHRYSVEEAEVVFDGTPDARFGVSLSTTLRDLTMFVRFSGRISEIGTIEPQLSSEPALYSQSQLFGFFLGGSPGGDPNEQTRDAVVGAGASVASQRVVRWIERGIAPVVPLRLDVAQCAPRLSDSAVVCTFGKWATKNVFVWYDYQSQQRVGDAMGSARLEWHFRPRWTLETAVDLDYAGADLTWRKRW